MIKLRFTEMRRWTTDTLGTMMDMVRNLLLQRILISKHLNAVSTMKIVTRMTLSRSNTLHFAQIWLELNLWNMLSATTSHKFA